MKNTYLLIVIILYSHLPEAMKYSEYKIVKNKIIVNDMKPRDSAIDLLSFNYNIP